MSCVGLLGAAAGAAPQQHSSPDTGDSFDDDHHPLVQLAKSSKMIGGPLMLEAALKVDKCLARLQSLQGTVTIPAPAVSATVSACISPPYSRSKSCIGSPKFEREDKEPVIRVHDILRFSDDFTGKFSTLSHEHRGKYLRRLSRSKTEVFDEKKDPRDPHGEWKHWSSGAGDVHKVVSEILMASQIAKEITNMVNACLVNTELGSSEDEKLPVVRRPTKYKHKHKLKAQASSSTKGTGSGGGTSKRMLRKEDPMHKFRVVTPSDSSKRRQNSGRKEVLYPKSELTGDVIRSVDSMQEISSTERKMQSRRSPRASLSPGTSMEDPVLKTRSKSAAAVPPAECSKAVAAAGTPRASVEEYILKTQARLTGKSSRIAAGTPRALVEEPVIRTHARLSGESSRAGDARKSCTPIEEPESAVVAAARTWVEEPFFRGHTRSNAVSVESITEDGVSKRQSRVAGEAAGVAGTSRSSVEKPLSRSHVRVAANAESSRASGSTQPASNDDRALNRVRSRVTAPECSSVLETPRASSVEDPILTRIRAHSSVLKNQARVATESIRKMGTPRSSVEETLSGNKYRVVVHTAESLRASGTPRAFSKNDSTRIRARVAAPEPSSAAGTLRTSVEELILTRIRTRVAAAAEPLRESVEEPLSKLPTRAASAAPSKSATTSDMWEAKEITNCYNSPRAIGESSTKKSAALPSSSAVKNARHSRSPPQASQTSLELRLSTSSFGAVQSSAIRPYCQPASTPIHFGMPRVPSGQSQLVNSPSRSRIGRLPQENVAGGASATMKRAQRESGQPRIVGSTIPSTSSAHFHPTVRKPSSPGGINVDSRNREITFELQNDKFCRRPSAAREGDNSSTTSNGSLKGGKNDDWFRKSLEATEISLGPSKLWKSGTNKAVLFSNPTFAPASPAGARPPWEKERSATPPVTRQPSPSRSTSATRRMKEWVGNVLHGGRRSVSPDIAGRLGNSNRKVISSSPGRSLPSLITRLPSRVKKASSAPRASVFPASSAPKEVGQLPLPPRRQAQQLAASNLTKLPSPPVLQVMLLKDHKEQMDRQAHQMAAQKLMMVEDWSRTVEPPAPFEKDVSVAYKRPGPVLYSKRQLNDMVCNSKSYVKYTERNSTMLDERAVPSVRYSWEPEAGLSTKKEKEIADFKRGSGWENEVGVIGILSQCRSRTQEQPPGAASAASGAFRRSCSTGSQRSTSTIRAMSTGKIRTGPSFFKRAKDWMRTQTPFRDRPQKTSDFSLNAPI